METQRLTELSQKKIVAVITLLRCGDETETSEKRTYVKKRSAKMFLGHPEVGQVSSPLVNIRGVPRGQLFLKRLSPASARRDEKTTMATLVKKILDASSGGELTESIVESMVTVYPEYVGRLDGFDESVRVLVRRDYQEVKEAKVAVISGGGSGHEPAHGGFIGKGLLTAAVCGDVFASPTAKAVACAIATVSGAKGCLLIVKNYTGDRLNFGIAAEMVKGRFGIDVETVYVSDDAALPEAERPRGVGGTIVVHKIAGALAEQGASLKDIAEAARNAAERTATMGAAYRECALPGRPLSMSRLGPCQVELGLGIHNEPGVETLASPPTAKELAERCVDSCLVKLRKKHHDIIGDVAIVVNNLGATSQLEMGVFAAACVDACRARGLRVVRCLDGTLVTSIDAHGASLSIFLIKDDIAFLDAPCYSAALGPGRFRNLVDPSPPVVPPAAALRSDEDLDSPRAATSAYLACHADLLRRAILAACDAVEAAEDRLTDLDAAVGDGDCGTTLANGARAVRSDVLARPEVYAGGAPRAVAALANVVSTAMGGSSGALYTLGFRAAETCLRSKAASSDESNNGATAFKDAFVAFARAIADCGGAGIGSATMCDATLPAAAIFAENGDLAAASKAAHDGAESTAIIHATHGRSAHVAKDKQVGVPDPGAVAIATMFSAVLNATEPN